MCYLGGTGAPALPLETSNFPIQSVTKKRGSVKHMEWIACFSTLEAPASFFRCIGA